MLGPDGLGVLLSIGHNRIEQQELVLTYKVTLNNMSAALSTRQYQSVRRRRSPWNRDAQPPLRDGLSCVAKATSSFDSLSRCFSPHMALLFGVATSRRSMVPDDREVRYYISCFYFISYATHSFNERP